MGEANRKRAQRINQDNAARDVDMERVAGAVNRLCRAASLHYGSDCILQAELAQYLLGRLGVEADMVSGAAAWRVGEGDGDVIAHVPPPGFKFRDPSQFPFHTWLRIGNFIFDVTTADLRQKAASLDAQDGGSTQVNWAPDHLYIPYSLINSYHDVQQGKAGYVFYQEDQPLTKFVQEKVSSSGPDEDARKMLWLAYLHPEANVFGPRNLDSKL